MAKNTFNFQAKMGLETKGFRKGVNQISASMNKLRNTFSSLAAGIGVGLGFDRLIGLVKNTSVELDTALNTLKNASNITKTFKTNVGEITSTFNVYGQNLSYVKDLSTKYGQDLVALTDSFAKFTAAANGTSIGLEDQKYIFEQLTRAAAAYHLSADRTADMMNAVTQMMSKGKVTAEELRRQLGNTLPGAFNIMAAAMGETTAQLDQMMKNGQVLASEALPLFAKRLEEITKNANFESLQNSMNAFKNAWYDVVEASGSKDLFKGLTDKATDILKDISKNFKTYMGTAIGFLIGIIAGPKMIKAFNGAANYFKNYSINAVAEIKAIEVELGILKAKLEGMNAGPGDGLFGNDAAKESTEEAIKLGMQYNDLLIKKNKINNTLKHSELSTGQISIEAAKETQKNLKKTLKEKVKARLATEKIAFSWKNVGKTVNVVGKGVQTMCTKISAGIKAILGPMALWQIAFVAISTILGKVIGQYQDLKELKEKVNSIKENATSGVDEKMAPTRSEIDRVNAWVDAFKNADDINSKKGFYNQIQQLVPSLNDLKFEDLMKKGDAFGYLAEETGKWAKELLNVANANAIVSQIAESKENLKNYNNEVDRLNESGNKKKKSFWSQITGVAGPGGEAAMALYDMWAYRKQLKLNKQGAEETKGAIEDLKEKLNTLPPLQVVEDPDNGEIEKTPLQKVIEESQKNIKELNNQKREIIKALDGPSEAAKEAVKKATEDIDEQLNKAYIKAFEDAAATGELVLSQILEKVANGQSLTKMEQLYLDMAQMAAKATSDIAAKTAEDAAEKGIEKWVDGIKKEQAELLSKMNSDDSDYKPKNQDEQRDARLDYKKTSLDIASEEFDLTQEKADELNECLKNLREDYEKAFNVKPPEDVQEFFDLLNKKYEELIANGAEKDVLELIKKLIQDLQSLQNASTSWKEAMTTEEMIQDLKDLSKEIKQTQWDLAEGVYSDFTGLIGSIDSVASAFQRLNDVVDDVDSTGWDRFMASFDIFTSTMDTVLGIIKSVNAVIEFSNILADLQAQKQANLNALKQQQVVTEGALAATTLASAGASVTSAGATAADAAASEIAAKAKAKEAVAETAKQNAKMGPLGWIGAIAGVAGIVAALASMSKFESGGLVGGNSTRGDKNIARLNSGEMILNKSQQGTLFNAIRTGNLGGGGGEWRVRGTDLIKVIDNTRSKIKG